MHRYLNIIIQLFSLAVALVPNLLYPAILGLHYHGEFIRLTALPYFAAFIISLPFDNLLLKEMARDKRLSLLEAAKRLLWVKLVLANLLYLAATLLFPAANMPVELLLLNSAAISSFALSALFADNRKGRIAALLGSFGLAAIALGFAALIFGMTPATLVKGNACLNAVLFVLAFIALRERLSGGPRLDISAGRIAGFFAISSALATLSYGIVAFAAPFMAPERLSILRIAVSIAQATTTFFPVSQRVIMENISRLGAGEEGSRTVSSYLGSALLLVGLVGMGATSAELLLLFLIESRWQFLAAFAPYADVVLIMAPALTLFLLASVLEKAVIGAVDERSAIVFGLSATAIMVVVSVMLLRLLPDGGFVAYTSAALIVALAAAIVLHRMFARVALGAVALVACVIVAVPVIWLAQQAGLMALGAILFLVVVSTFAFAGYILARWREPLLVFLKS